MSRKRRRNRRDTWEKRTLDSQGSGEVTEIELGKGIERVEQGNKKIDQ